MNLNIATSIVFLLLLAMLNGVNAQLSVANVLEYQVGNLPYTQPRDLTALYHQLKLSYHNGNWEIYGQLEQFGSPIAARRYTRLTQRRLAWNNSWLELRLGNFYEILGNGLLLHTFEIPGAILEDRVFRSRYGFFRDLDGAEVRWQSSWVEGKFLFGRPLLNSLPPLVNEKQRRMDWLGGGEMRFSLKSGWQLGMAYLANLPNRFPGDLLSLFFSLELNTSFQIFGEHAWQPNWRFASSIPAERKARGTYLGFSLNFGPLQSSMEWKKYRNFSLNFNNPPSLIKEHAYILLNRSTHVLLARNESGWQWETFLRLSPNHLVTLNWTEAVNRLGRNRTVFQEKFAEWSWDASSALTVKIFVDHSQEPVLRERQRIVLGSYLEMEWQEVWGLTLEVEGQQFIRHLAQQQKVQNTALAIGITHLPGISFGIQWETSNDPLLTDNLTTIAIETQKRHWIGVAVGYEVNNHHYISLFYGKRRGGTACNSGICYEVLDFEGLEMRWTLNL